MSADAQPNKQRGGFEGPVLLIGGGGMLGRAWSNLLTSRGIAYRAPDRDQCDIASERDIENNIDQRYPLIVNCAAWTDVDGAQTQYEQASRLNTQAPGNLARRCAKVGARLLHYSTDYVFDGQADKPYAPQAKRLPVNAYGRSKAEGEQQIEQAGCAYLIIRVSGMYAPWGRNFVRTMARLMRQRERLRVVNDQRTRVTSAEHLARASLALIEAGAEKIYHFGGGGDCTWFEFASQIAQSLAATCQVDPCTSEQYPLPAKRPAYSVLDISATERVIGPSEPWPQQLDQVLGRLEPEPDPSGEK